MRRSTPSGPTICAPKILPLFLSATALIVISLPPKYVTLFGLILKIVTGSYPAASADASFRPV